MVWGDFVLLQALKVYVGVEGCRSSSVASLQRGNGRTSNHKLSDGAIPAPAGDLTL